MRRAGAVLAALMLLAACGDAHRPPSAGAPARPGTPRGATTPAIATTVPSGRAAFISAADGVCDDYRREVRPVTRALNRELRGAHRGGRVAALLDRSAAAAARAVRRIGALTVPEGDGATIAAYLDTGREAARALRSAADAVRAQDADAADRQMAAVRLASSRGRTIATGYGFLVCGTHNPQAG